MFNLFDSRNPMEGFKDGDAKTSQVPAYAGYGVGGDMVTKSEQTYKITLGSGSSKVVIKATDAYHGRYTSHKEPVGLTFVKNLNRPAQEITVKKLNEAVSRGEEGCEVENVEYSYDKQGQFWEIISYTEITRDERLEKEFEVEFENESGEKEMIKAVELYDKGTTPTTPTGFVQVGLLKYRDRDATITKLQNARKGGMQEFDLCHPSLTYTNGSVKLFLDKTGCWRLKPIGINIRRKNRKRVYRADGAMCVSRRRLARIPIASQPTGSLEPLPVLDQPSISLALPVSLGCVSVALIFMGCVVKRKFMQLKKSMAPLQEVKVE